VNPALQQFLSVALPIMVTLVATIWIAQWSQNKRFDDVNNRISDLNSGLNARIADLRSDMNRRFDEVNERLERIESKLENHDQRITRVEERTSPLRR
jgi:tetrahydromethanopterin S-methyltransferase subunit G